MIHVRELQKYYTVGANTIKALDGVSLDIADGEYVTVVGTSGSGKSTLMNILGCLDAPTSGSYLLDGEDVAALSDNTLSDIRSLKIGFIFQSFNLIQGLTALENVELPLLYRKVPKKRRGEIAMRALESVKLSDRALHRPTELSGGQQQRVAIARAIAADPAMILADEPCGNLDSRSGSEVLDILSELSRRGKTVVMITHNEDTARKAQRLVRISDGRILQ
ncbi:MAG: ABC transporter ATP-binding protein [Lachnospiraceae bacterium]|nr:ABC transporter ATP-binding protein [Ruminococcus sp.]MCM1275531.1 ABC transporter ATP-binding protein [Lachnospiraceae bacterium]